MADLGTVDFHYSITEGGDKNSGAARRLFQKTYLKILKNPNELRRLQDNKDWVKKEIRLLKGAENFLKIEGPTSGITVILVNKNKHPVMTDDNCVGNYYPERSNSQDKYHWSYADTDDSSLCVQYKFEPFYTDEKIVLLLPAHFAKDYKITIKDAVLLN
jgi:hypothetical protein